MFLSHILHIYMQIFQSFIVLFTIFQFSTVAGKKIDTSLIILSLQFFIFAQKLVIFFSASCNRLQVSVSSRIQLESRRALSIQRLNNTNFVLLLLIIPFTSIIFLFFEHLEFQWKVTCCIFYFSYPSTFPLISHFKMYFICAFRYSYTCFFRLLTQVSIFIFLFNSPSQLFNQDFLIFFYRKSLCCLKCLSVLILGFIQVFISVLQWCYFSGCIF